MRYKEIHRLIPLLKTHFNSICVGKRFWALAKGKDPPPPLIFVSGFDRP